MFEFTLDSAWNVDRIPAGVLLGVFCGILSLYFIRLMTTCEGVFAELRAYPYTRLLLGGIILSSLIFLFPVLYGEGYKAINVLLSGNTETDWGTLMNNSLFYGHGKLLVLYIALVTFTKVFATSATNGSGGCGGTFAPSLFVGGFGGFLFARFWNINNIGLNGWCYRWSDACTAYRNIPYCRNHWWLSAFYATHYSVFIFCYIH